MTKEEHPAYKPPKELHKCVLEVDDFALNAKHFVWAQCTLDNLYDTWYKLHTIMDQYKPNIHVFVKHELKPGEEDFALFLCRKADKHEYEPFSVSGEAMYHMAKVYSGEPVEEVRPTFMAMLYGGAGHLTLKAFNYGTTSVILPVILKGQRKDTYYKLHKVTIFPYLIDEPVFIVDNELSEFYFNLSLNFILWLCTIFGD